MFNILIVDDEKYIRNGIADHIDWKDIGCQVVGMAADGEEALIIVDERKPNLIITDITMPIMNGLELVEEVKKKYPDTYIIIISGYDEFNYVQKALKLGAEDYVLKPVDLDYLKNYVIKLKDDYEQKIQDKVERIDLIKKVEESTPMVIGQIIKDIIYERVPGEDGKTLLNAYGRFNENSYLVVIIAQVDDYSNDENSKDRFNAFTRKISKGIKDKEKMIIFDRRDGEIYICLVSDKLYSLRVDIDAACNILKREVENIMHQTLTIAVGQTVEEVGLLAESYTKALDALSYKFILGKNQVIDGKSVRKSKRANQLEGYADFDDTELFASIKFSDTNMIKENLEELELKIRQKGKNSYLYTNIIVGSIYRQAIQELEESGGNIDDVFEDPIEVYNKVISRETISGMISQLHEALLAISNYIRGLMLGKTTQIEKSKDYIKQNYSDSEISLEEVAKYVNMSISYFSTVFKQEVDMTFVDYLTKVRILEAKNLLKQSYKSYEVSDMVGYNNPTYFSTVFKRVTGITPSKYK